MSAKARGANGVAYARSTPRPTGTTAWQLGLGGLGLLVSAYLTATHYFAEQVPLACSTGGFVDCEQVTTSAESMIGAVPVAVLGLVWFGVLLALVAGRRMRLSRSLLNLQMGWAVLGLLSIFYLVYAELFLIGALCLWCTVVHALVVVLFLMTLWEATG